MLLVLVLALFCGVSRVHCTFVLSALRFIVRHLLNDAHDFMEYDQLITNIPRDPRTLFTHFDLHPRLNTYVCCPTCFALYHHDSSVPNRCNNMIQPENKCGAELMMSRTIRGHVFKRPKRIYVAQSLKEWLGRLLSRPEIERCLETTGVPKNQPSDLHDVWDGAAVRSFLGPDKKPFFMAPKGQLRLIFSLSMDGFNPFGESSVSVSSTAMYMACLNLPPKIRYKAENVFLAGVIPGPNKPLLDAINHAQNILVTELLEFWEPGVYFSRTALYEKGRLVKAALLFLVADILAARQMAGFSAVRHTHFCSVCYLTLDEMENLESQTWPSRDDEEHLKHAKEWRMAKTKAEQDKIFDKYALRWSELLELPYWKAVSFTTIDSMHAHWINSVKNHIWEVWGVNAEAACTDGKFLPESKRPARPSNGSLREGLSILQKSELKEEAIETLMQLHRSTLFHLCLEHDIRRAGTKKMMAMHLIKWVNSFTLKFQNSVDQFFIL